jgi:nucleotide-binding universal stress UspA family protein
MQWHPSTLAIWGQGTPEEAQSQHSSSTMLCGEVVTLHDNRQEADLVVTVSHVGSLDEGERFIEFATERIVRDRLFRLYPGIQGWSRGSSLTRISDASMVAERCIETSLLYVGEFEEPVYTFHAHVHFEEAAEAAIVSQWRQNEQYERVVMGGLGLGGLAWLFAIIAGYMHINLATGGRHRTLLRICGLACIAAPFLLVLMKIRMT